MKTKEFNKSISQMDNKSLLKDLKTQYESLQKHRFLVKFRNLKDISQIKKTKRNIARIYTALSNKYQESVSKK